MLTGTNVEEKKGTKHKIQLGGCGLKQAAICKFAAHNEDDIQVIRSMKGNGGHGGGSHAIMP